MSEQKVIASGGPIIQPPPVPDLSHLTEEERRIIESVMARQREEEEKEREILRKKQDEVKSLEETIRTRIEEMRRLGTELDATCQLCLKTKFADGVGHTCTYCRIRCCARCGGKVSLRSNKVIWVCILCRKKQEILIKTGSWIHGGMASQTYIQMAKDLDLLPVDFTPTAEKKPKLERAHSSEKENVHSGSSQRAPLQRSSSGPQPQNRELKRQYSQEQKVEGGRSPDDRDTSRGRSQERSRRRSTSDDGESGGRSRGRASSPLDRHCHGDMDLPSILPPGSSDRGRHRDTGGSLSRKHDWNRGESSAYREGDDYHQGHSRQRPLGHGKESDKGYESHGPIGRLLPDCGGGAYGGRTSAGEPAVGAMLSSRKTHLDPAMANRAKGPGSEGASAGDNGRRKIDASVLRNDSLSSDQSECVRPPPPKPHKHKRGKKARQRSLSSSDDEIRSTPEYTSCDEQEIESESVSEKDKLMYGSRRMSSHDIGRRPSVTITSPGSPDKTRLRHHSTPIRGRLQIKLWFDAQISTLFVTVVCAAELPPKPGQQTRNPYVKMFLLPDESGKSKRRTKTLADTNAPQWNETFMYSPLRRSELQNKVLGITVWDYDKYANDFVGEVNVTLASSSLDGEPEWYLLQPHGESLSQKFPARNIYVDTEAASTITSTDHLSPPSTTSRLSDSDDLSELDIDDVSLRLRGMISRDHHYRNQRKDSLTVPDKSLMGRHRMATTMSTMSSSGMHNSRTRSKSPRRVLESSRSLSPPDGRIPVMSHTLMGGRPTARSVSTTPTTTPPLSRRQLPRIPSVLYGHDSMSPDLEERARLLKMKMKPYGMAMYSDSEATSRVTERYSRSHRAHSMRQVSPEKEAPDIADSDLESISALSTQSERPRGSRSTYSEFTNRMQTYGPSIPGKPRMSRSGTPSGSGSDVGAAAEEKPNDGSLSDTAVVSMTDKNRRKGSYSQRVMQCLSRKSNSTSQLSATGFRHRLGFRRKQTITVHRSEEIAPSEVAHLVRQQSGQSSDGEGSQGSDGWIPSLRLALGCHFSEFVEGLGPGQLVGRQVLASPSMGDIQLSLCDRKGNLEIEVIRARGLTPRPSGKGLPAPYVKLYMVNGKSCVEKAKTSVARRTLDPLYQQVLTFTGPYQGCVLQVAVWGEHGRIEKKKAFLGVAQILLDDLDLSNIVIGWYKLFSTSSLVTLLNGGSRRGSMLSLDNYG